MSRYELGAEAERRGYKTGVELGVQTGVFAEYALKTWPSCQTYYLVDIWRTQENYVGECGTWCWFGRERLGMLQCAVRYRAFLQFCVLGSQYMQDIR
jgi:hypothetical protein